MLRILICKVETKEAVAVMATAIISVQAKNVSMLIAGILFSSKSNWQVKHVGQKLLRYH